jgi:hypothetical protein
MSVNWTILKVPSLLKESFWAFSEMVREVKTNKMISLCFIIVVIERMSDKNEKDSLH